MNSRQVFGGLVGSCTCENSSKSITVHWSHCPPKYISINNSSGHSHSFHLRVRIMFLVMQIVGCSNGAQVTCFTSEERCTVACVASFLAMHYRLSLSYCVSTRLSRVSGPRYLQYVYFLWLCLKRFVGFITRSLLFFLRLFSYVKCTLPRFFFYTIL